MNGRLRNEVTAGIPGATARTCKLTPAMVFDVTPQADGGGGGGGGVMLALPPEASAPVGGP